MITRQIMARSLPAILVLMGIAVILILAGSTGAGFVLGLVAAGIAAVLLGSMFIDEVGSGGRRRQRPERRPHRRTHASGF